MDFGEDEETTSPSKEQVSACISRMYINNSLEITPLGYKLNGSGIDDQIWFKCEIETDKISNIFDSSIIDTSKLKNDFKYEAFSEIQWWDVANHPFECGGNFELPNNKFMSVVITQKSKGYIIYVNWFEN